MDQKFNILIGADWKYYSNWCINLINTTRQYNPWINIHVVIVNPEDYIPIEGVNYYHDIVDFPNEECKVAYYQAVRFLKVPEIFPNDELVITLDCDTVCSRPFNELDYLKVAQTIHVQRHQKADKWMAGLVTYGSSSQFRHEFKDRLMARPLEDWRYGWDQDVLNEMAKEYSFEKLRVGEWLSFGKGKGLFLTLKGEQKVKRKFLDVYNNILQK